MPTAVMRPVGRGPPPSGRAGSEHAPSIAAVHCAGAATGTGARNEILDDSLGFATGVQPARVVSGCTGAGPARVDHTGPIQPGWII